MGIVTSTENGQPWRSRPALIAILFITGIFPFSQKLAVLGLIAYFLIVLIFDRRKLPEMRSIPFPVWASMAFYLVHVISLAYSSNMSYGLRDLETKMALLLIPISSVLLPRKEEETRFFSKAFVGTAVLTILLALVRSIYLYVDSGDIHVFFYDSFSFLMHPTYYTMFLNIALLMLLHDEGSYAWLKGRRDILFYTLLSVLLLGVVLTSSRAGMVITVATAMLYLLFFHNSNMKLRLTRLVVLIGVTGFIFAMTVAVNPASRFSILFRETFGIPQSEQVIDEGKMDVNPLSHRLLLWKTGLRLCLQNPLGTGSGDIQDVLVVEYAKLNFEKAVVMKYNPHNQYIQTLLATGFAGLLCLLMMFIPIHRGKTCGNPTYYFLGAVIALNGLFESVLEVQRGVILFALVMMFYGMPIKRHAA